MTNDREAELRAHGVTVGVANVASASLTGFDSGMSLSGYGAFTPITVRPYTTLRNAELERDQLRDRQPSR